LIFERARLVIDADVQAADGLAMDEALVIGSNPDTCRFYTYADHAVLVGRYQRVESEVNIRRVDELGFGLSRRSTGGGTILMGADQLGIACTSSQMGSLTAKETLVRFSELVACGLRVLGIEAKLAGKNDLEVDGAKVAGLGLYRTDSGRTLCHASVLADLDIDLMLQVIQIPVGKMKDKVAATVRERTATVSALIGRKVRGADLIEPMLAGFSAMGVQLNCGNVTPDEIELAEKLSAEKYSSPEWVLARGGVAPNYRTVAVRTALGTIEIELEVTGAAVTRLAVTGDFNQWDERFSRLERSLRWLPAEPAKLAREAALIMGDVAGEEDFYEAFRSALVSYSAPIRVGSCYLPEGSEQ
jgi:lipoate-protein ligase A